VRFLIFLKSFSGLVCHDRHQLGIGGWKMLNRILTIAFILGISAAIALVYANAAKAGEAVTAGLVGYWTFDEADMEGETIKDVWGNNDGTLVGDPATVEGKVGKALEFDGTDGYVEIPDDESLQLWNAHTLEAWIYQKESRSSRIIDKIGAGTANGLHLDTHPGTTLRSCAGDCVSSADDYTLEEWHHVAITFDEGNVNLYIDGAMVGEGSVPSPLAGNDLSLRIAADSNGQNLFLGIIDEVRVYNRALSEGEINQNMNAEGLAVASPVHTLPFIWGKIKVSG